MSKTKHLLIVLLSITISVISAKGQKDSTYSKWGIGIAYSLDEENLSFFAKDIFGLSDFNYTNETSYSFGLTGVYNVSSAVYVKTGLQISQKRFAQVFYPLSASEDMTLFFHGNYLEVPILFGYNFLKYKFLVLSSSIGTINGKLLDNYIDDYNAVNNSHYISYSPDKDAWPPYNPIQINIFGSINAEIIIGKRFKACIVPYLQLPLIKLDESVVRQNTFSYGSYIGIYYLFKRKY